MSDRLPEEEIDRLLPALSPLAGLIGAGNTPDHRALRDVLLSVSLEGEGWVLEELKHWSEILEMARGASSDADRKAIIEKLRNRGIPEFPAILAVESASGKRLSVEPLTIDFGSLRPGEGASATVRVVGRLVNVVVHDDRLKVTLFDRGFGNTLVKVMLSGGSAGESFRGDIVLQGDIDEVKVPVRAQWEIVSHAVTVSVESKKPPLVQKCPKCPEKSLFWNYRERKFECLNPLCRVEGPSLDRLAKPHRR